MREIRSPGSVRGVPGNRYSYRDTNRLTALDSLHAKKTSHPLSWCRLPCHASWQRRPEHFFDVADRSRFLLLLQQGQEKYHHRVHAYCLMNNHVHLALQVTDTPLSKVMQNLSFRYTQHINRKQKRTGHLFQGRFKALLIDEDDYLLELVRYIHLNPLRAGIVKDLDNYPWSSHGCFLGQRKTPWLTTDWVLSQWNENNREKAQQGYWRFVQDGFDDGYKREFHRGSFEGRALGDDRFIEQALNRAEERFSKPMTMNAILDVVCDCYGINIESLSGQGRCRPFAEARAVAAWLVRQSDEIQLKDLGKKLHRDLSGLSQAARRIELRAIEDDDLSATLEQLKAKVINSVCQA